MEFADGTPWRNKITPQLKEMGITCFDPYHKPFINEIKEDDEARRDLDKKMLAGEYDWVANRMKQVRSDDLRLCDLSDFGIAQIVPKVPTYGTVEEISWFVRCKKPLFIFVEGGKVYTPKWVMGMVPHKYIYDSLDEVVQKLVQINDGEKELDNSRWRLLKKDYR